MSTITAFLRRHYIYRCTREGKRYVVCRGDGTLVCEAKSAAKAWKKTYELEVPRFEAMQIARDALTEGRLDAARQIADQLDPDLAAILRLEIKIAEEVWRNFTSLRDKESR